MLKKILNIFIFTIIIFNVTAQNKYTLSGELRDSSNGETLIGAVVKIIETNKAISTNTYGYFALNLPLGNYTVQITYLGFQTKIIKVNLEKDIKLNVKLVQKNFTGKEVVIKGEREDKNIRSTEMSTLELSGEKVKQLPVIFGEPDILKAITLLPGIKSGGEGGTGFYVRGGGPDQNLILMDEAVVYNPSHLFGFLSVFNTDAVKNLEVIKGGMPANYGGRLSSILNVTMREGNNQKYEFNGGVGLIASRFSAEGPIKKGKSSFLIAARRTYIDVLAQPFLPKSAQGNAYYFYDINLKLNWQLGPKDKLYFSGYFGRDILDFISPTNKNVNFDFGWGNSTATLRWNHIFKPKLFSNTSLIYNRYDLFNDFKFGANGFSVRSGLNDWNLKSDFTWFAAEKHLLKFGFNYIFHTFTPGIATGAVGTIKIDEEISKQYAHEFAIYAQDEWQISQRWSANAGLRAVAFNRVGPYTQEIYNEDNQKTGEAIKYGVNESLAFYPRLEPRLNINYLINEESSVKASYTKTYQFIHLATTSGAQFPVDLWVPSSAKVKPQEANQVAIGYFRNFKNNRYEASAEAYYKLMDNQIEFKPLSTLFFNANLENEMVFGQGKAYGLELFLKKKVGRLNGWIGYTWSRAYRQFDELNRGQAYFFRYDRTHDMSLVLSYTFNKKWTGTFVFVYGTGNAVTLPNSRYAYRIGFDTEKLEPKFTFIDVYDKINSYRLPAYHRADISFTYTHKKTKNWESNWNFSIYNIYNRANPYFIYFLPDLDKLEVKAYMVYLFPILPSVAWNFKF
jgi:hypothetical protein